MMTSNSSNEDSVVDTSWLDELLQRLVVGLYDKQLLIATALDYQMD